MTPYQPGVQITPSFTTEGEFTRFEVQTPDGFIYTFGQYRDHNYIDRTQDMTYILPNFYAYPEKSEENNTRELFGQAQIDVSIMERFPFFNGSSFKSPTGIHTIATIKSPMGLNILLPGTWPAFVPSKRKRKSPLSM